MPSGTRPDAIAPAIMPRKNGVITDDSAKETPNIRWMATSVTVFRNANAEPRRMTPKATIVSGI
jgi:hypothetical protein